MCENIEENKKNPIPDKQKKTNSTNYIFLLVKLFLYN